MPEADPEARMAERLLNYFADPHMDVSFSEEGRLAYTGLCTSFTVQCALARDGGEFSRAARMGAAPSVFHYNHAPLADLGVR